MFSADIFSVPCAEVDAVRNELVAAERGLSYALRATVRQCVLCVCVRQCVMRGVVFSADIFSVPCAEVLDLRNKLAPPSFLCPINVEIMRDPVTCANGHSYERSSIEHWLATHNTSPKTGSQLLNKSLTPNHVMRNAIEEWLAEALAPAPAPAPDEAGASSTSAADQVARQVLNNLYIEFKKTKNKKLVDQINELEKILGINGV